MMAILAIDTSTRQLGVAVVAHDQVLSAYTVLADYPHAVELPGAVSRVLAAAGMTLRTIEGVAVDLGPGSFTGLRIGLAFVKALAAAHPVPIVGIASLDLLAANIPAAGRLVCAVLDARQGNVYAALYRVEEGGCVKQSDYSLAPVEEILGNIHEPALFVGDGCAMFRDRILAHDPRAELAPAELWWPNAATLGRLGLERLQQGQRDDPARLVPLYLYPLDCSVRGPHRPTSVLTKSP